MKKHYCLACGSLIAENASIPLMVDRCEWCGSPCTYTVQEQMYLSQCMVCGVLLSGPYTGMVMALKAENGHVTPDLTVGISHGVCQHCSGEMLLSWRTKKRQRQEDVSIAS